MNKLIKRAKPNLKPKTLSKRCRTKSAVPDPTAQQGSLQHFPSQSLLLKPFREVLSKHLVGFG